MFIVVIWIFEIPLTIEKKVNSVLGISKIVWIAENITSFSSQSVYIRQMLEDICEVTLLAGIRNEN